MRRAYWFILMASAIFSTMEIAGRTLARDLHPLQVNFWRFLIASLVLLPLALHRFRRRRVRVSGRQVANLVIASIVGIVLSMAFFQMALTQTKASTVAVIVSCNPVIIIPIACIFLKEEFNRRMAISVLACLGGILCILNPLEMSPEAAGIGLGIASAVTFALYSVIGKGGAQVFGSLPFACFTFVIGTAATLGLIGLSYLNPFCGAGGELMAVFCRVPLLQGFRVETLFPMFYIGLVGTGLGFILYLQAIDETSAATGSVAFFIKPALAPVLALLILGEGIPLNTVYGIGLIIVGTYFAFSPNQQRDLSTGGF